MSNIDNIFIYDNYQKFISILRESYSFIDFKDGSKFAKVDRPLVILRHDVDMDMVSACNIASIEESVGIRSNFFFMLCCPLYNLFTAENSRLVRQILSAGHHFGLHFDCASYKDISKDNIEYYIDNECRVLEDFFKHPIEAISFHRPRGIELSVMSFEKWPNTYEKMFVEDYHYFSDSKGIWRDGHPLDSEAYSKRKKMHILVHPIWWTSTPVTPYKRLVNLVINRNHQSEQYISENCQVWNEGEEG